MRTTLLFVIAVAGLRGVAFNPVKPFTAFYLDLEPGMTEEMVEAALRLRFPAGGKSLLPSLGSTGPGRVTFTLDPTKGDYNSEFVVVEFERGRLVRADYLPD